MVTGRVHTQNRRTATTLNPLLTLGNLWGSTTTLNLKRTHKGVGGVGSGRGEGLQPYRATKRNVASWATYEVHLGWFRGSMQIFNVGRHKSISVNSDFS